MPKIKVCEFCLITDKQFEQFNIAPKSLHVILWFFADYYVENNQQIIIIQDSNELYLLFFSLYFQTHLHKYSPLLIYLNVPNAEIQALDQLRNL